MTCSISLSFWKKRKEKLYISCYYTFFINALRTTENKVELLRYPCVNLFSLALRSLIIRQDINLIGVWGLEDGITRSYIYFDHVKNGFVRDGKELAIETAWKIKLHSPSVHALTMENARSWLFLPFIRHTS